ncbi:MAG: DUF1428 domain-containing protein [Mesorhizobium sp.]
MTYVNGMVAAVPKANKQAYLDHAKSAAKIFREFGATSVVEGWGADVPKGETTDFWRAVQAKDDEVIVFSWISWPNKATHDAGWEKLMKDERMMGMDMPFDGKRMIYGTFETIFEA